MKKWISLLIMSSMLFVFGCAPADVGKNQIDYDETKKMVVDILKTDDGKKAIEDIMTDEKMKQNFVMGQPMVKKSVEETLTSEKGIEFWKKTFEDTKFVESYAKSMQSEHEKIIKGLMKDPDYQRMMLDILKNPEMEKEMTTVLKSQDFRKHFQTLISETFESPLFKAKIEDILIKAAEDLQKEKEAKKESGDGGNS
ncbi:spore germination lipoprotein GerD [Fredinandcohnia quinoae]|uniref:Spore gernimation protein GerD n=1 Tax=Fredinandcohnia quinoae TaxID=2918902 RepID=A0AAW5E3A3_9BACI|nr:spore germination lipoprotein GerD [Fredinandcohnia sp. SECRCQ15]MCH1626039.1 spore gernimation protein GerD [Fredinandcohnia sp. SECRCQ15]